MAGDLQPLDDKFAIVGSDGRPTLYFIEWAQQRQIDITEAITLEILQQYLDNHALQEGSGIQITPSGSLNDSPTIAADVQEILDQITTTRGSIIYRNASDWVALTPGTSGQFLKTQGVGADPVWATAGGAGYEAGPAGTVPTAASLATWLNQGTSTLTDGTGALVFKGQVGGGVRSKVTTVPAAPFSVYARIDLQIFSAAAVTAFNDAAAGISFRDSADNEVVFCMVGWQRLVSGDDIVMWYTAINRYTASGATYVATPVFKQHLTIPRWIKCDVTSTTITFSVSEDGKNWILIGTETIATFIDAVTDYGVGVNTDANATEVAAIFSYFSTTAPV